MLYNTFERLATWNMKLSLPKVCVHLATLGLNVIDRYEFQQCHPKHAQPKECIRREESSVKMKRTTQSLYEN